MQADKEHAEHTPESDEAQALHKEACEYEHWHERWLKVDTIEDEIRRIEALPSGDYDADVRKREELASLRNALAALLEEPGDDAQASGAAETRPRTAEAIAPDDQWTVRRPKLDKGYTWALHRVLVECKRNGEPRPTARRVLDLLRDCKAPEISKVLADSFDFYDARGNVKTCELETLRKSIANLTDGR